MTLPRQGVWSWMIFQFKPSCDCLFHECCTCSTEINLKGWLKKPSSFLNDWQYQTRSFLPLSHRQNVRCSNSEAANPTWGTGEVAAQPWCHSVTHLGTHVQDMLQGHHPVGTHTQTHTPTSPAQMPHRNTFPVRLEVPIFSCLQESQVVFPNPPPLWTKHWGLSWVSLATRRTMGFFQLWKNQL